MIDMDPGATAYQDMTSHALTEKMQQIEQAGNKAELPRWKCHKEVWALKISRVKNEEPEIDGSKILIFDELPFAPIKVGPEYCNKHQPKAGGYYVVYADGYQSFSPAQAFEEGYTRITPPRPAPPAPAP